MEDLKKAFRQAQRDALRLKTRPSNDMLLQLYAFYKQGSVGDASGKRPGLLDFKERAKFDAWARLKGQPSETAMQSYVKLVAELAAA